jgi:hypothetical protein
VYGAVQKAHDLEKQKSPTHFLERGLLCKCLVLNDDYLGECVQIPYFTIAIDEPLS